MTRQICKHLGPKPSADEEQYSRLCTGCGRYVKWGLFTPGWEIDSNPHVDVRPKPIKPGVVT